MILRFAGEARRTRYWKALDRRRLSWERVAMLMIAGRFRDESGQVVKAYKSDRLAGVKRALKAQRPAWQKVYERVYVSVGQDFARTTRDELQGKAYSMSRKDDEELGSIERRIRDYLKAAAGQKIDGITQTSLRALQATLAEAYADGLSTESTAREIEKLYAGWGRSRAHAIARTEVLGASNLGAHEAARDSGLTLDKTWIATKDERVRDAHLDADGQRVGMDEAFAVGGPDGPEELLFPGDSSLGASAGNIINCRCSVAYQPVESISSVLTGSSG